MDNDFAKINKQYGQADLIHRILSLLEDAGYDLNSLSLDDLALFDQLHEGGRLATLALAEMAEIKSDMCVLDIGCGIGGPARTLAAENGCKVTGIDLTEEFCNVAEILTERVGLADQVTFRNENALELPFDDESFDLVFTQNTIMNIEDKATFLKETIRVLKTNGRLAIEAGMTGPVSSGISYPIIWANDPSVNFLVSPREFRKLTSSAGLSELDWEDITPGIIVKANRQQGSFSDEPAPIGLHLIYDNLPQKRGNTKRAFTERRLVNIRAVYKKLA